MNDNFYLPKCTKTRHVHAKMFNLLQKKMLNYKTNFVTRNTLKLTYSNVEIQNFPGGETPGPPLPTEGRV